MKNNKNKLVNFLKIGVLLFGISILLWNCEDENIIAEQPLANQIRPTIKTLSENNVGQIFNTLKSKFQLDPYLRIDDQEIELSRGTQDTLGVTIYTDEIKEVTLGNYTSYTMRMVTPTSEDKRFYNLTIEDKNGESGIFVTKYIPTENWLNDKNKKFEGTITTMRGAVFTVVGDDDTIGDETNSGDGDGGGGSNNNTDYPTDCNGMVFSTTNLVGVPCGCGHWPGQTCHGSTCGSPTYPYYENVTTYECVGASDNSYDTNNSNDTDNSNNTNDIGGGSSTGNGIGNVSPDDSSISVLLPPDEECNLDPDDAALDIDNSCDVSEFEKCFNALPAAFDSLSQTDQTRIEVFINENQCNDETSAFANLAIEALDNDGTVNFEDRIVNKLSNPCAKNIFTEIENGIFEDHPLSPEVQLSVTNILTLNFSETILKLFNDSEHTDLIIQNGNTGISNAQTLGSLITLGDSYLVSATELSIARTIIHEAMHAYLNTLYSNFPAFNSFSLRQKMDKYAEDNGFIVGSNEFHHNYMGQYIDAIAFSLYDWDKNYGTGKNINNITSPDDLLGWVYYKSMAYSGMFQVDPSGNIVNETDTFIELVPTPSDRQAIADLILNEKNGNSDAKGTECD